MKRLLIGILALAFLLSFCPKMVEVVYAQEIFQMETSHLENNQRQGAATHHNPQSDSNDHTCCAIHGGSNFVEHLSFQKRLPRNSDNFDGRFLLTSLGVPTEIQWVVVDQKRYVFDPPPFFQTNDFERRSEVMRR